MLALTCTINILMGRLALKISLIIRKLRTMWRSMSRHWRRSKLRKQLRWIHRPRINHLIRSLAIFDPVRSMGCPKISKQRYKSRRCPKIGKRQSKLKALVRILNSRMSNLRMNLKMDKGTSISRLIFIWCFINDRHKVLESLALRNLMVVSIHYLRREMSRHALRIGSSIPIDWMHKHWMIRNEDTPISSRRNKIVRHASGIHRRRHTRPHDRAWLVGNRLS